MRNTAWVYGMQSATIFSIFPVLILVLWALVLVLGMNKDIHEKWAFKGIFNC